MSVDVARLVHPSTCPCHAPDRPSLPSFAPSLDHEDLGRSSTLLSGLIAHGLGPTSLVHAPDPAPGLDVGHVLCPAQANGSASTLADIGGRDHVPARGRNFVIVTGSVQPVHQTAKASTRSQPAAPSSR